MNACMGGGVSGWCDCMVIVWMTVWLSRTHAFYGFLIAALPNLGAGACTSTMLNNCMGSAERDVGSSVGTTGEGMSGSITASGLMRVLTMMAREPVGARDKVLIDIGSGIGRPQATSQYLGVWPLTYGIEIGEGKWKQALSFLPLVREKMFRKYYVGLPMPARHGFLHDNVQNLRTLEPGTHIFSAWEGNFTDDVKQCVGRLFVESRTARVMAVVQKCMARGRFITPAKQMEEWGFGRVELVQGGNFDVCMQGSRQKLQAYIFRKVCASGSSGDVTGHDVAEDQWAKAEFAPEAVLSCDPSGPPTRRETRSSKKV